MTKLAKEEDLNHLSFLREVSILKEGAKAFLKSKKREEEIPLFLKSAESKGDKTSVEAEKLSFLNIPFKPVLSEKLKKEVEKAYSPSLEKETVFLEDEKNSHSLDEGDFSTDFSEEAPLLKEKKKWDFSLPLFNKRKKVVVKYLDGKYAHIPVVEKELTNSMQIVNSKSLLVFCSNWVKTIFDNQIVFRAIPATGTNLLIFPKGHYYFVQFMYQKTPIHPTQEMIQQKLSPLKVFEFHDFKTFRNFVYEQMRSIQNEGDLV